MTTSVYEEIKASCTLPSPTGVALKILELTQDEHSTLDQLAAVVESDPAIASRLLKLINAPLAGMPRRIASVPRAVALLGARTVASLSLSFTLVSNHLTGDCPAFNYDLFWSESMARAVAARHIASRCRKFPPDEAFTCGLLCRLGRLALATAFPDAYGEVLKSAAVESSADLAVIEREAFGIDHEQLAAAMMSDWHMPRVFCDAVLIQSAVNGIDFESDARHERFARILHLSDLIASVLTHSTVYCDTLSALVIESNQVGIAPQVYHEMFDGISQEWREVGAILSVKTRRVPPIAEIYERAEERRETLGATDGRPGREVDREKL